jgi:hypothetical protein
VQPRKSPAHSPFVRCERTNRHQSPYAQAFQLSYVLTGFLKLVLLDESEFRIFSGGVEFQEDVHLPAQLRTMPVESFGGLQFVDRLNTVEQRSGDLRFVALQMADQVQLDSRAD